MKGERLSSRLVLGGALATFLGTAAVFLASVAPVRAQDCYWDGRMGIGPNCRDEWGSGGYGWSSCAECAFTMCTVLGGNDYECVNTCIYGAYDDGCS